MFEIGVSEVTITPPVGVELAGYGFGANAGVLDELQAQALVLADGTTAAVVLAVDLLMVGEDSVAIVRARIEAETGVPGAHVIVAASHSHSAPTLKPLRQWGRVDAEYARSVEGALVAATRAAWQERVPVRAGWGRGAVANISENRRRGHTLIEPAVPVLRFDDAAGAPIAVLTNFACHPVTLHSYRNLLSPDYPGTMRRVVRQALVTALGTTSSGGPTILFTLGPSGDINPAGYVAGATSPARSRQVGAILGCEVAKAALDPTWFEDPGVAVVTETVDLPVVALPQIEALRAMRDHFAKEAAAREAVGAPWPDVSVSQIKRDWVADALAVQEAGTATTAVPCEITALRLGDVALVALPLEVFTETSLSIQAVSPAALTVISTNSNGGVGYLPTRDAYEGGDYTNPEGLAPKVYGLYALAPEAEPLVGAHVGRILQTLFD